ncbi:hypothetical protein [Paraburkholderia sp. HD33-4]|uniref:hypothetical protein n=1 Tax=Paraburkholderia sp. HD33-4 TaxID=2883242 RepID=UPI001F45A650|nr:hypothetical protein [Paraburkholderia sp. HD33-4]
MHLEAVAKLPIRFVKLSSLAGFGALLQRNYDWKTRLFTTPEAVVEQLAPQAARPLEKVRGNRMRPLLKASRWSRNAIRHAIWRLQQQRASRAQ